MRGRIILLKPMRNIVVPKRMEVSKSFKSEQIYEKDKLQRWKEARQIWRSTGMKVLVKELISFLSKATVDGIIRDALLDFGSDGLRIVAFDESHTGGVNAVLFKDGNFQDYTEMQVPIKDTAKLIRLLKMIDGEAELLDQR